MGLRLIQGGCHCRSISYILRWPAAGEVRARECACTFCRKHATAWTSHREARLDATVAGLVSKYKFGTDTAEFHVCARCGVVPFVTSDIDDRSYAVVNVNTFEGDVSLTRSPASFSDEDTPTRLGRRKDNWIPDVTILLGH